ncbi:MAG: heavy-metal-associated domain-containing protein [Anaerolineaceae bacterium]|nr:heavy-metal-associated domain-containing protein [Anaerolineaceae bacterium]
MKKVFKLKDLDCANCAAKMENNIKKIPGVTNASVNFMMQKMTIESDVEDFDALMKEVVKVISKVEPDCEVIFK